MWRNYAGELCVPLEIVKVAPEFAVVIMKPNGTSHSRRKHGVEFRDIV